MSSLAAAGAVLFSFALVLFLLEPLLTGRVVPLGADDDGDEDAFRKHAALKALRDLEYDYQTGKLDDADYRSLQRELVAEAAQVMEGAAADPLEQEIHETRARIHSGEACPRCGSSRSIEARFCGACGARLGSESDT